jgi:hypothetical protein
MTMTPTNAIPTAMHRGEDDLPFVSLGDGTHIQLLQVSQPVCKRCSHDESSSN